MARVPVAAPAAIYFESAPFSGLCELARGLL